MRLLLTTLWMLAITATATAGPLDPANVSKDAKWVIHIDHDALCDTALMKGIREQRPEMFKQLGFWMKEEYGVDPQQDLHGLTMFSDTYESHSGVAIMSADFNRNRVRDEFASKLGVNQSDWKGHTFYTWNVKKNLMHASHSHGKDHHGGKRQDTSEQSKSDFHASGKVASSVTAVLVDRKTLVFAPTVERAKWVVKLLDGELPTLEDQESSLLAEAPEDAFCYGAAIELQKITQADYVFPILRQHEQITWTLGERDGEVFEKVMLVAHDDEVAKRMKQGIEGLVSLAQVWAADAKAIGKLYEENLLITRDANRVWVDWHGDSKDVVAALKEVKARFLPIYEARREHRSVH